MALAECRECGKEVSTQAASCPHCGAPSPTPVTPGTVVSPTLPGPSPFKRPIAPTPAPSVTSPAPRPAPSKAAVPAFATGVIGGKVAFDVYEHPSNQHRVYVKRGFNWPAFLFGPFWFLARGLALWGLFWLVVVITLGVLTGGILVVPAWLVGSIFANANYRSHLLRQGYHKVAAATATAKGVSVESTARTCPQCKEIVKTDAVVCRFCGHRFGSGAAVTD